MSDDSIPADKLRELVDEWRQMPRQHNPKAYLTDAMFEAVNRERAYDLEQLIEEHTDE